jgi:hypothetical protein
MLTAVLTAIASCTDAVGIEQCRMIETARCESAVHCGFSEDEALRCVEFYHDQCLHGIENASERPDDTQAELCVDAIQAVAACAQKGTATMQDCPQAPLVSGASLTLTPCAVILKQAHLLAACAFVSSADAGPSSPPDSGSEDAGDSGDGAPE